MGGYQHDNQMDDNDKLPEICATRMYGQEV